LESRVLFFFSFVLLLYCSTADLETVKLFWVARQKLTLRGGVADLKEVAINDEKNLWVV
jgi:hypothetical protein